MLVSVLQRCFVESLYEDFRLLGSDHLGAIVVAHRFDWYHLEVGV